MTVSGPGAGLMSPVAGVATVTSESNVAATGTAPVSGVARPIMVVVA